ncbi:flagellin [Oxalobacter vibrioformis]|uniref:Flagellin n=1 Tax=Oxalobacter vibrioformis TaxID=933080 RepID=A0A9E9LVP9_9BURK|nr:flagellin [Oxalobacter vibrioformis]WAW09587.1 flagellin [Oxalobacter vibrioformis]
MPQIINTNMMSLNSQRHLNATQSALSQAMERLSSGKRINSAKDDAAGLGISERMTSQINGMNQAIRNARDGISLGQTAEGALSTMNDMLQRVRVLAVQSSNATNSPADRQALQDEVGQLVSELNRIAEVTTFNGQNLLNGTMGTQYFQVGPNANEVISANGTNFMTTTYGNYRVLKDGATPEGTPAKTANASSVITGYLGKATLNMTAQDSARTIAEKINLLEGDTGVTASAKTTAHLNTLANGATYALALQSNNATPVVVSFAIGADNTLGDAYAAGINAINAQASKTGVTAEYYVASGGEPGIRLTNPNGNDISLESDAASTAPMSLATFNADGTIGGGIAIAAGTAGTAFGQVTIDSPNSFVVTETTAFAQYLLGGTGQLMPVSTMDVSTFDEAQKTLAIVDSALVHIVGEMARYGALQARFESTISNLEVTAENTTNSRSRITDADYAQETAALSRASILQQAGTSMLAQANQIPQTVLGLLQ